MIALFVIENPGFKRRDKDREYKEAKESWLAAEPRLQHLQSTT
jgi:hypothetical protein